MSSTTMSRNLVMEKMSTLEPNCVLDGPEINEQNMSLEEMSTAVPEYVAADPKHHGRCWRRICQQGHPTRIVASIPTDVLQQTWQQRVSLFAVKLLWSSYNMLKIIGFVTEWTINFFVLNGGIFSLLLKILYFRRGKIVIPNPKADNYLSAVGLLDPRSTLYLSTIKGDGFDNNGELDLPQKNVGSRLAADLCIMAAKLAYENPAVVKREVEQNWRMHFVNFYNCWNEYQKMNNTQAFVFMDKPKDAEVVVVAFRGTEAFNAYDWSTDIDFSWVKINGLGKVHLGFLEALGLVTREDVCTATKLRNNASKGRHVSPRNAHHKESLTDCGGAAVSGLAKGIIDDEKKSLAFDDITNEVACLLDANPQAKLFVTGHSLGGALSSLYATMLHYTGKTVVAKKLAAVYTFGQPRVGDEEFAAYGNDKLTGKYFHVVYCNDIVPRVPFDDRLMAFKHFGACVYFNSVFAGVLLHEEPNPNFFGVARMLTMRLNALWEVFQGLILIPLEHGHEYSESVTCFLFRALGLVLPGVASHSPCNYVNSVRLTPYPLEEQLEHKTADIFQEIYLMKVNVLGCFSAVASELAKSLGVKKIIL